jgi:lysine 2,3-aminomutase
MPNYLVSASENAVVLRNYEGLLFRYAPEDRADGKAEHYPSLGVSNLLSGNMGALVPEDTPRYRRRQDQAESTAPAGLPILDGPHFQGIAINPGAVHPRAK